MPEPRLPCAHDIERLAVALAAAQGHFWPKLDGDAAFRYRLLAHTALVHLRDNATVQPTRVVRETLELATVALRRGARAFDQIIEEASDKERARLTSKHEGLVQELYFRATGLENIDKVLAAEEPVAAPEDEPI